MAGCAVSFAAALLASSDDAGVYESSTLAPVFDLAPVFERLLVDKLELNFVREPHLGLLGTLAGFDRSEAVGRNYVHRQLEAPFALSPARLSTRSSVAHAGEGGLFDVWELAKLRAARDRSNAVRLTFKVKTARATSLWIGLGSSDNCAVSVNRQVEYLIVGARHRRRDQDLVAVSLSAGIHEIALTSWKSKPWAKIPDDHHSDDWGIELNLYSTAEGAWASRNLTNFHTLDSPVVRGSSALRAEGYVGGHDTASLFDLKGEQRARGKVGRDGSVKWLAAPSGNAAFVGFFVLGQDAAEPVVLSADRSLESLSETMLRECAGREDSPAWPLRVRHLLKPDFTNQRDAWWARKLAVSLVMSCTKRDNLALLPLLSHASVSQIWFDDFISNIDGIRQYYRTYVPPDGDGNTPVVVVLPTAPSKVRPHLYSYQVADLIEAENWASAARESKVAIFWPSYVDVDYGGLYAQQSLTEGLAAFERKYPMLARNPRFLVGFCSAAIGALGYATIPGNVDGLVLCTSFVQRPVYRWFKGLTTDSIPYPDMVMDREDWHQRFHQLSRLPTYVNYDADVEGHGDPKGTRVLLDQLQQSGAPVQSYWPDNPDKVFVWGTRAHDRATRLFRWMRSQLPKSETRQPQVPVPVEPKTVKEALLRGYFIATPSDDNDRRFVDWWTELLAQYRGEKPQLANVARPTDTIVRFTRFDAKALEAIQAASWLSGKVERASEKELKAVTAQTPIWGFRLQSHAEGRHEIEVIHSDSVGVEFPRIDLVVDGCCTGAIFTRGANGWNLLAIGIPEQEPQNEKE